MGKIMNIIKAFPFFLLKMIYILPFFLLGLWLIQMVYFPEMKVKRPSVVAKPQEEESIFRAILRQEGRAPRGHFHMVDEYISQREPHAPLCLTCHGTYPHSKGKKVRAMLNLHTGFLACAVCHARKEPGEMDVSYTWVDRETGEITMNIEGEYGKYSAKIFPIKITDGAPKTLFRPVNASAAREYLRLKDNYTPDQIAQAKMKLHENISSKPVFCSDCHKKDGYLNFTELGFPKNRVIHLASTEVVGMIEKYKTFYLPSEIDFGSEK